jgi:hypothetical protein
MPCTQGIPLHRADRHPGSSPITHPVRVGSGRRPPGPGPRGPDRRSRRSAPNADEPRDLDRETTIDAGLTTATGQTPTAHLVWLARVIERVARSECMEAGDARCSTKARSASSPARRDEVDTCSRGRRGEIRRYGSVQRPAPRKPRPRGVDEPNHRVSRLLPARQHGRCQSRREARDVVPLGMSRLTTPMSTIGHGVSASSGCTWTAADRRGRRGLATLRVTRTRREIGSPRPSASRRSPRRMARGVTKLYMDVVRCRTAMPRRDRPWETGRWAMSDGGTERPNAANRGRPG